VVVIGGRRSRWEDDGGDGLCGPAPLTALEDHTDVRRGRSIQPARRFVLYALESRGLERSKGIEKTLAFRLECGDICSESGRLALVI
jgi:hypothetical protein